ncbi:TIGR00730 family Rossman fold protein [Undibacterium sp. RTI2.1]|uniref:LOG family protein n=1 Tax=unclassified Undibacterium TaxID=2630295 RepID=UPI002AB40BE6|nr:MULTISPECIES: TIGR00730 family Rossman fold protein [unclassified Undibacterium]MDY7538453.1 TIGR00730 family Rossman fold protein [Undibacterium sp. 5I1]MEB0030020.1 TIGR00730 family Rossman fold protein [Undibacterium sp. RTI2.1]MEB0114923.1 TIGR00730 family Rossman fold protein [Undibacterium sp. RTI2.2]MEB0230645.1 TIGR00730 family Rossman fold protein [Undibacterium sp. 10I3]MEB0255882.1 TIGR00730 family Rossman fold protein [Undibacterium sp. 5I1]
MKSLCVYCGSSIGDDDAYAQGARQLAAEMVSNSISLVYGGGNVGLMGVIADEVLRLGGQVTGVIPQALMDKEVGHTGLSQLHIVKNMHERKAMMAELSDGFIAMPGGVGTLEELFEMFTWSQLGFHQKPLGLLNIAGFYNSLLDFLQHTVNAKFLKAEHLALLHQQENPAKLILDLQQAKPLTLHKWVRQADI